MVPLARPVNQNKAQQKGTNNFRMTQNEIDEVKVRTAITEHVKHFWPNSLLAEERWGHGPILESVPNLTILKLLSHTADRPVVYVTNGCFASDDGEHIRHEFFIISPREERQHVETLTMLANFHADKRYKLDLGSLINIGDPLVPGSTCDHLLISLPYPYGPKLEWLELPEVCVRFLWALPITAREAAFVELNGAESLEKKFDEARVNYQDPFRSSVV
jgi:suppressor of fused protein SUFU